MAIDSERRLRAVLDRALEGHGISREGALELLRCRDAAEREQVFAASRELRRRFFGEGVFLYGFIYASTYCRNDCRFCFYRSSNTSCRRYRKDTGEIVDASRVLAASGIHLLDLTMGEDPRFVTEAGPARLADLVEQIRGAAGLPIMVSPGVLAAQALKALRQAGAEWYALYQETHDRARFAELRPGQDYQRRWQAKLEARRAGLLIEEGILCGVGELPEDVADSLEAMGSLDADQLRAMSFVPAEGIPLIRRRAADSSEELLAIAAMRLSFPDRLIPASLDVRGLAGLAERLAAGANVVTSLVPPGRGLAGVAQSELDIEAGRRSMDSVRRVLDRQGLEVAPQEAYAQYLRRRREAAAPPSGAEGGRRGQVGRSEPR